MSRTPKGLRSSGWLPDEHVPSLFGRFQHARACGGVSPQGNLPPREPRAAYSYSSSDGSRLRAQAQYAAAWAQVTQLAGC